MTNQIKALLVFLAILAAVSVFSFFDVLGGVRAVFNDPPKPLPLGLEEDADQDGLSNTDESYWNTNFQNPDTDGDGFLDGEEVVSGFDPREPSSHELGDSLADTVYGAPKDVDIDFNITEDLTEMMVLGINAQDLKPGVDDQKFETGVNALSLSVIDNFYKTQALPLATTNIIANSAENQTAYLNAIANIVKGDLLDFPQKANLNAGVTGQLSFFSAKSNQYKVSYDRISALNIPEDWLDIHNNILNLLYRFYLNYRYIAGYDSDILKATLALTELSNLNIELPSLLKAIRANMAEANLSPADSLYQVMDLIYKE